MGLPYFEMELVNLLIPEREPLFPSIIAANLKWIHMIPDLKYFSLTDFVIYTHTAV